MGTSIFRKVAVLGYPIVITNIDDDGTVWGYPDYPKMNTNEYFSALYDEIHSRVANPYQKIIDKCKNALPTDK